MNLIVGLGNPGEKYKNNRHNVGFMFVDYFFKSHPEIFALPFKNDKYLKGDVCISDNIILLKPHTYMNLSGESVQAAMKNFKLKLEDIIIAHDDLDIPLGKFKIQIETGPKLHNGLESIEQHLNTKNFIRVRIGVDARTKETWIPGEAYALQNFTQEEHYVLNQLFPSIAERLSL